MNKTEDRVDIINAIHDASSNELKALAEIKNAITSQGAKGKQDTDSEGKVSRRLTGRNAAPEKTPPVAHENPYLKERTSSRQPNIIRQERTAIYRRQTAKALDNGSDHAEIEATVIPHVQESVKLEAEKSATGEKNTRVAPHSGKASPAPSDTGTGTGRDSKGRFLSKGKNAETKQRQNEQKQQKADAKLQAGFFRKLTSIMGVDRGSTNDTDSLTDAVGVGAGGPVWLAAKGSFDIAKEASNKVTTLTNWLTKNDKPKNESQQKETPPKDALTYPAAEARPITPPVMGRKSTTAFNDKREAKSVQVVQEQTQTLAENDRQIIGGLEDISDELIKLRKSMGKGDNAGLLGKLRGLLPGAGRRGTRWGGCGSAGRRGRGRKRGKVGAIGRVFGSVGARVAAGTVAAATAVTGGRFLSGKAKSEANGALKNAGADAEKAKGKTPATKAQKVTPKATESAGESAGKAKVNNEAATHQKTPQKPVQGVEKGAEKLTREAEEAGAAKVAQKAEGKAAGEVASKAVVKTGAKAAAKGALRMVPLIGTTMMTAYDAVDGYNDTDAQRETFNLKNDQEASTQQKSSYAAANVVDMGGIVSGLTNLAGKGASALGMTGVGETLQNFNTGTIARGVNDSIDGVKSLFQGASSVTDSLVNKAKEAFSSTDSSTKDVKKAVEDGTAKTVSAINDLKTQLQGGTDGEDGVGLYGNQSAKEFSAPANNTIATDLNIGGSNARNRNFRNNNIGNLNFANQEGASLEAANAKGERRFARFNTPEEGIRALANQVSSYYNGTSKAAGNKKLQTVSSIIAKWAPPDENNTNQYIKNVCEYLGVSPTEKIDVSNPEVMTRLVRAIATKEGGNPAVNDDFIKNALGSYNQGAGRWEGQFSDESLTKINAARTEKGEQALAKDSQYSVGGKVKLASGAAPAAPVQHAVPLKAPEPEKSVSTSVVRPAQKAAPIVAPATEPEQHAQAAKKNKPKQDKPAPTTMLAPEKAAPVVAPATEPEQHAQAAKKSEPGSSAETQHSEAGAAVSENDLLAAMQGDASAIAKISSFSGEAGIMPFAVDLAKSSASIGTEFLSSGGAGEVFDKKSRDADRAMTARIEAISGKKFGFRKAVSPALVSAPARTVTSSDAGSEVTPRTPDKQTDVPYYDNGYQIVGEGESKGFMGSLLDSSITGLKQLGSAVLPTAGEHLSRVVGGISGNGVIDDLVGQFTGGNTDIARAISPLTKQAGNWLNGGIQRAAGGINSVAGEANNMLFGGQQAMQEPFLSMPAQLNTVTDLARSGIRQPLTSDTANHDPAMLSALEDVHAVLKEILTVNRTNGKASAKGDPDKVVKTSQPEPRQRVSTTISDPSLDALLED